MGETDDGLDGVPEWDAKALRMAEAIERSVARLDLDSQGELVAIINAIQMQLESRQTEPEVVRLLTDSFGALTVARPIPERARRQLGEALNKLVERVEATARSARER